MAAYDPLVDLYEPALNRARANFSAHQAVSQTLSAEMDRHLLHLFLIYLSSLGVRITEPVEGWIERAGERCRLLGFEDLGRALLAHAKGEANHHLMMIEDTINLVAIWNERNRTSLDTEELLSQPATSGVKNYCALHERVVGSDTPYAQIAIEYEIEKLSVDYGPRLLTQCMKLLPPGTVGKLSFVQEHISLDVGHTQFNQKQLSQFLIAHPNADLHLIQAGSDALVAYAEFLGDCLHLAKLHLSQTENITEISA
jgi:hypothetical protein